MVSRFFGEAEGKLQKKVTKNNNIFSKSLNHFEIPWTKKIEQGDKAFKLKYVQYFSFAPQIF